MTDRELLELAAKAAGYGLPSDDDHDEIGRQYEYHLGLWVKHPWGWGWFRPHIDDGQSLRLAVALGISFQYYRNAPPELGVPRECAVAAINGSWYAEAAVHGDWDAATRRAITIAAAQIQLNKEAANE